MKNIFNEGDRVKFNLNGKEFKGIIVDWDYNACTFEPQYDIRCDEIVKNNNDIFGVPQRMLTAC